MREPCINGAAIQTGLNKVVESSGNPKSSEQLRQVPPPANRELIAVAQSVNPKTSRSIPESLKNPTRKASTPRDVASRVTSYSCGSKPSAGELSKNRNRANKLLMPQVQKFQDYH